MTTNDWTAVIVAGGAFVLWLIRLEGRVNTNEALQKRIAEDVSYLRERLDAFLFGRHDS